MGFRVQGSGFRFRVQGSGFRAAIKRLGTQSEQNQTVRTRIWSWLSGYNNEFLSRSLAVGVWGCGVDPPAEARKTATARGVLFHDRLDVVDTCSRVEN